MRTAYRVVVGVAAGLLMTTAATGTAAAGAPPSGGTDVTFEILPGTLAISTPTSAYIAKVSLAGALTGQLGVVTVTDGRGVIDASWSASVTATNFTTGGGTEDEIISPSQVAYWSGQASSTTGVGVFTPGQPTADDAKRLDPLDGLTTFSRAAATGLNSATWDPTLTVAMTAQTVAGVYSGSLTHSVV